MVPAAAVPDITKVNRVDGHRLGELAVQKAPAGNVTQQPKGIKRMHAGIL